MKPTKREKATAILAAQAAVLAAFAPVPRTIKKPVSFPGDISSHYERIVELPSEITADGGTSIGSDYLLAYASPDGEKQILGKINKLSKAVLDAGDEFAKAIKKRDKFSEISESLYLSLPGVGNMEAVDIGKIKIDPFKFESILQLRIEKGLNEHSTLYVYGIVKDGEHATPVTGATEGTAIKCENGDDQTYFNGVLQNVKITCIESVYYLEVFAVSNTVLLDTVKRRRTFQDNSQTYKEIIETVVKQGGGSVTYNAPEMKVENIILQYDETDWEFAKRLASHTQDVLLPIAGGKPAFHFGVPDGGGGKLEASSYSVSKNFDAFRRMSAETAPLTVEDVTVYTVKMNDCTHELGAKFNMNGTDLHICHISLSLIDSALTALYTLCAGKAVSTPKSYNRAITGLVLDGTVLKVEGGNVKLHLDIDEEQDEGKACLFSYATSYSAEEHTGWYVMPEEGDTVRLLFPNEDEKHAYAASSVRREDTDKTSDPLVKYLRTPFGKEIKLDEKEILITSKDDETFIRINEETGVEIITPNPVLVRSGSTINIESKDDITVAAEKNLFIQAKESIEMSCGGNIMKFVPSKGIAVSSDKKFELTSEDNVTIDGKKEIGMKSGMNLKLDVGAKLAGSASSGIELASAGSSVKLASGGVDIKGAMIKEN